MLRVAILGGGVAGLSVGLELQRAGHHAVVLERDRDLGTPGPRIAVGREEVDPFCHPVRSGDTALLGMLGELGELGRLRWQHAGAALLAHGESRALREPVDFLAHADLTFAERQRARAAFAWATRMRRYALDLDRLPALTWLRRLFGERVCEAAFRPYLQRRFGEYADEVPAHWAWSFLGELRRSAAGEACGQLQGGARALLTRLCAELDANGGEVHVNVPVTALELCGERVRVELDGRLDERFDAVVSTLPGATLGKLARGSLAYSLPAPQSVPRARISATAILRRSLSRAHRTFVLDPHVPFDSIVQTSAPLRTRDRHVVYFERNTGEHTDAYWASDERIAEQVRQTLAWCYGVRGAAVEAVHVARAPAGDAISTLGASGMRKLAPRVAQTPLYLCSRLDAYPRAPTWDTEVRLAREVGAAVCQNA